jgi:hypothetical protein
MKWTIDEEDGLEWAGDGLVPTTPTFNRDGWYYDRKRKLEWFEYRGQAFRLTKNVTMFQYCVSLAEAKVLSGREVQAYREVLRLRPPKHIRKSIENMLRTDAEIKNLREIRLSGFRRILAFKKEEHDHLHPDSAGD